MRIIEWNGQGAFRSKNDRILKLLPDILVISECESVNKLKFGELTPKPNDFFWYGDSENKGIGIFSYSDFKFELLKIFNPLYRYIIPLKVTGHNSSFLLFAIWAMNNKNKPETRYIGQIWKAINYYSDFLSLPSILTGDFNSNKIWDNKERIGNHSEMVAFLEKKKIYSLYHKQENIEQGQEIHPTFYLYRKANKPYHIDYFFASESLIVNGFKISIEKNENWNDLSDHVPLILDFKPNTKLEDFKDNFCDLFISKCEELSPEIQTIFRDKIKKCISKAEQINKITNLNVNLKERIHLFECLDKLIEIDKLKKEIEI